MARGQRTIFFDVGNVLIDDDPFRVEAFRLIRQAMPADHPKAQLERFLGDVERALRFHGPMAVERMGLRCLGRAWPRVRKQIQRQISQRWWHLVRMVPGSPSALEAVRGQCRLGIIANQPAQVWEWLDRWGLLPMFDLVLLDSQQGVAKPDLAIFRIALARARVDADACVMVGDRLDNDIIPARRLGMRAVLLWLDARQKAWDPEDEWGQLLWPILERLPVPRWERVPPRERPMALARRWEELPRALELAWATEL